MIILIVLIVGAGGYLAWQFFGPRRTEPPTTSRQGPITLNFWGVFDEASIYEPIIADYQQDHPGVTINYTRQDASLYEFVSVNELAAQTGPDVWLIPAEWLPKHRDKLAPVPAGFLAKQNVPDKPKKLFSKAAPIPTNSSLFDTLFASVTKVESLVNDQLFGIPLSVDSLGLYANSQALVDSGYATPPQTWEEVIELVKKVTKRTTTAIEKPAIALGTSNNVGRASEILTALMIQNHTNLVSEDKTEALYNQPIVSGTGEPIQPGLAALDFYTSFASRTKEAFTWSPDRPLDYEAFAEGQLPLFIDYSFRVRDLNERSPALAFVTAPLPQIAGTKDPATVSNALVVSVPGVSDNKAAAWDFIEFLTNRENSARYARSAGRPPARVELTTAPGFDPRLLPFIAQIPYAKTWYRNEINKTTAVTNQAIDAVLAGQDLTDTINRLTKQVTHILRNEPIE